MGHWVVDEGKGKAGRVLGLKRGGKWVRVEVVGKRGFELVV